MIEKYKITVVVPVYNAEKKLPTTVLCLRNQSYSNLEIIFVNDCSTDNSLKYLQEQARKDSRLIVIDNQANQRALRSRWIGATKSTGDYLFFCDADDELPINALEMLIRRAEKTNADMILGAIVTTVDRFKIIKSKPFNIVGGKLIDASFSKQEIRSKFGLAFFGNHSIPVSSWGKLISRKTFLQFLKYEPPRIHIFDDVYLNLILFKHINNISFIPDVVYYYKYGGVTSTFDTRLLGDLEYVHEFRKIIASEQESNDAEKYSMIEILNIIHAYFLNSILIGKYDHSKFIRLAHHLQELVFYQDLKNYSGADLNILPFMQKLLGNDLDAAYTELLKEHNKTKFLRIFRRKIAGLISRL